MLPSKGEEKFRVVIQKRTFIPPHTIYTRTLLLKAITFECLIDVLKQEVLNG
jgi:hypothetical protein